jgi:hypothetical protein
MVKVIEMGGYGNQREEAMVEVRRLGGCGNGR